MNDFQKKVLTHLSTFGRTEVSVLEKAIYGIADPTPEQASDEWSKGLLNLFIKGFAFAEESCENNIYADYWEITPKGREKLEKDLVVSK